jgi:hypothetical protein
LVDPVLVPALKTAIRQNEIGSASAYRLSFACLGASGASFGIFQGDTNVDHVARDTLRQALMAAKAEQGVCDRIIGAVSKPLPDGNPLSQSDSKLANDALNSAQGQSLVDAMDAGLLRIVLGEVDTSISAAASRQQRLDPVVIIYIALWVNMTGAPSTLNKWLAGTSEVGLAPPIGPRVTRENIESYLQANTFFRLHPRNFIHMQDSVGAAMPLPP